MQRGFAYQLAAAAQQHRDDAGVLRRHWAFCQRRTAGLRTVSRHVQRIFNGKTQVAVTEGETFDKTLALTNWLHN